ncbi:MAG: translation initiation factor IF-2 N-terminal domain-containing protein, partial [bacterium]
MRVHELAKELSLPSKDVVDRLTKLGAQVISHMSTVDDATATLLRNSLKGGEAGKAAPAKPKASNDVPKVQAHAPKIDAHSAPKGAVHPAHKAETHSTPQAITHPVTKATVQSAPKAVAHPAPKTVVHPEPKVEIHPVKKTEVSEHVAARPQVATATIAQATTEPAKTTATAATDKSPADDKTIALRGGAIVVKDLAEKLKLRPNQLIAELMAINVFAAISDRIDIKVAQKIASKRGITLEHEKKAVEHKPVQK